MTATLVGDATLTSDSVVGAGAAEEEAVASTEAEEEAEAWEATLLARPAVETVTSAAAEVEEGATIEASVKE